MTRFGTGLKNADRMPQKYYRNDPNANIPFTVSIEFDWLDWLQMVVVIAMIVFGFWLGYEYGEDMYKWTLSIIG